MKKIGFIDFFLDEWHANNFPTWIRDNCKQMDRDMDIAYAWAESPAPSGVDTATWCKKYEVEQLATLEEVVEKSDFLIVFSPDHPEHHEHLAHIPLMSGKPTYIDKTFSPDLLSGVRMCELASKSNTPMFSSSALRNAKELAGYLENPSCRGEFEYVATSGPGKYANYAVHQFEMIVALLGPGAVRVKSLSSEHAGLFSVEYPSSRRASMLQIPAAPFQVHLQFKSGDGKFISECSDIFPRQIHSILDFFETRTPPVPKEETLEIMALIDAGRKAATRSDTWITVEQP